MARPSSRFFVVVSIFMISMLILPQLTGLITQRLLKWARPELDPSQVGGLVLIFSLFFQEVFLALGSYIGLIQIAPQVLTGFGRPRRRGYIKTGVIYGLFLSAVNVLTGRVSLVLIQRIVQGLTGSTQLVQQWVGREQQMSSRLFDLSLPVVYVLALGVLIVVIVPFAEELFFRGLTLGAFKERLGTTGAMVFSSLFFSLAHLYIINFFPVFVLGALLALLYERTRSLVPCIIAHATVNGIAVLLILLQTVVLTYQ
ncbi:MAG: CPBP family intramembrane metalloprotease [Limnochordia bacterium]|nr:CPBP family intramembrane metalloprotease [Limnochordia bacterium]